MRGGDVDTYFFALVTFVLGAAFLSLEVREFAGMIARGAAPQRSAFLSAFFTLVGCHGLHVTAGLIWLAVMMAQVAFKGFRPTVDRRLLCFALFWHALDIIWVWLFTAVYLMGIRLMTDTPYDRAPGEISTTAEAQRLTLSDFGIYTIGLVLAVILTATSFWVANTSLLWAPGVATGSCRARHRPDGRSPGLFPAHHDRTGQHQQRTGAGVRRAHRVPGRCRIALDHDKSKRQHDAHVRTDEFADAALTHRRKLMIAAWVRRVWVRTKMAICCGNFACA